MTNTFFDFNLLESASEGAPYILDTIKNANNILVMTNYGIEESGTHDELIKKNGVYAKLYEMYSN